MHEHMLADIELDLENLSLNRYLGGQMLLGIVKGPQHLEYLVDRGRDLGFSSQLTFVCATIHRELGLIVLDGEIIGRLDPARHQSTLEVLHACTVPTPALSPEGQRHAIGLLREFARRLAVKTPPPN
jgi:hypothetical protein